MTPSQQSPASCFEFETLHHAVHYRRALVREFTPFLTGQVLEVGAGIGQITALLIRLPGVQEVCAVEPNPIFCQELARRLPRLHIVCGTMTDWPSSRPVDAIVSVNVLEHIEDDSKEMARYAAVLRGRGGTLCLFVPARMEIYSPLDLTFGHYRRYRWLELREKLVQNGFTILRLHYFNFVGYLGWWFNFRLLKRFSFSPAQVKIFDRIIFPVTNWIESHLVRPPIGQSLLAIAQARG